VATSTPPQAWWDESAETLATIVTILETNAEQVKGGRRHGR
jgi:hypothetical protein